MCCRIPNSASTLLEVILIPACWADQDNQRESRPSFSTLLERAGSSGVLKENPGHSDRTPRSIEFGLIQAIHINFTFPISHHYYDEMVGHGSRIGIHFPTLSPHPDLWSQLMTISVPSPYIPHQDWVVLDCFEQFTIAWAFQCLITIIMNVWIRSRWDLNMLDELLTTTYFGVIEGCMFVLILGLNPHLIPRLIEFGLLQAMHMSWDWNSLFNPSPITTSWLFEFWVTGWQFDTKPLHSTPRLERQ